MSRVRSQREARFFLVDPHALQFTQVKIGTLRILFRAGDDEDSEREEMGTALLTMASRKAVSDSPFPHGHISAIQVLLLCLPCDLSHLGVLSTLLSHLPFSQAPLPLP